MIPHAFAIFDVDDVVVDMDNLARAAQAACRAPLVEALGESVGAAVHADFVQGYADLRGQLRAPPGYQHPPYEARRAAITRWQRGVTEEGHEVKIWSRQTLLAVAMERHGVPVTGALIHRIVDDTYWRTVREMTQILPDAEQVMTALHEAGIPVQLATNSDGFLRYDEASETFRYDPDHAVAEKHRRLSLLERLGLYPRDISVGDPVGKPDERFYDAVVAAFEAKLGTPVDLSKTIAIGDSLTNDVEPLMRKGAVHGAWLLRNHPERSWGWLDGTEDIHRRIARLTDLRQLFEVDWSARPAPAVNG